MLITILFLLNSLLSPSVSASEEKILTEDFLLKSFREESVGGKLETADVANKKLNASLTEELYQARLYTNYSYQKSRETALSNFQPILSPNENWTIGVEKNLSLGLKVSADVFGTQYSLQDNSVKDATQVGGRVNMQLDLWKNIFGTLDRARLRSADKQKKRADLEYYVGVKKQETDLRKAYWSFVSVEESIRLSEELIKTSELQLNDAKNRFREGATDKGEVARYQSQVESRKASKLLFEYEKQVVMQVFERQLKDFSSSNWQHDYKITDQKQPIITQCIQQISSQKEPNPEYTFYEEMIALLKEETNDEIRIANKHGDMDVALLGQYQTTGVANEYGDARENLDDRKKSGYLLGVQVSIPLGSTKSQSEKYLLAAKKNSLDAMSFNLQNEIRSAHDTMIKSIDLLNLGLNSQLANSNNLEINYKEMQRKYRQGRIPFTTLILEQDALFQSRLREIEIKKQIAHVVLDYFTVFNKFPCSWNQI